MQADLAICGVKDRLDSVTVWNLLTAFQAQDSCVRAPDQVAHTREAQALSISPIFEFHVANVREMHIVVNAAFAQGVHK